MPLHGRGAAILPCKCLQSALMDRTSAGVGLVLLSRCCCLLLADVQNAVFLADCYDNPVLFRREHPASSESSMDWVLASKATPNMQCLCIWYELGAGAGHDRAADARMEGR